jgi:nucleoside-diphosphate-sugar epimerase
MANPTGILVVGGSSRIGAALRPLLGERASYVVRRRTERAREIVVADYAKLTPEAFRGVECMINCVGISTGRARQLHATNADLPQYLAATAKAAGVRRLIHISSFSVYGNAQAIDITTREAPISDYGQSKLAGDRGLLALSAPEFGVMILRLPLIYAVESTTGGFGKLGQLLKLWTRVRWLPTPAGDVERAMIGVDLAAQIVARLAQSSHPAKTSEILLAADPMPFTYADLMRVRPEPLRCLTVPRILAQFAMRVSPALGGRLFADSRLATSDNLAIRYGFTSRLYQDIGGAAIR